MPSHLLMASVSCRAGWGQGTRLGVGVRKLFTWSYLHIHKQQFACSCYVWL